MAALTSIHFIIKRVNLDPRLLKLARSSKALFILTVVFGFAVGFLAIAQARYLSGVIGGVFLRGEGTTQLRGMLVWLLGIIVLRAAAGFMGDWHAAGLAKKIKIDLRERLFAHLLNIGPDGLSAKPAGELALIAQQGIDSLEDYFSHFLPQIALAAFIPLGVLLFVFPLDPITGVILLVTGPLIPFFMFLIGSNAEKLTSRQFRSLRLMSATLLDTLQGLKTLKALGRSKEQAGRIAEVCADYRDTTMEVLRVTFISALALEWLGTISTAVIAVQVGIRLLYGLLAYEEALFLLVIAPEFYLPLRTLGLRYHASVRGVSSADQIYKVLDIPSGMPAELGQSQRHVPDRWEEITFSGVRYQYPDREAPTIDGLDIRIRRGNFTALVGESGAGKSTAASLLLRFLVPQEGTIAVGGIKMEDISVSEWRENIAWVPQRAYMFNGTIRDNLRIANESASNQDLWGVLEFVHLHELVRSLSDGLDTSLGEGGSRLSSGQAKRLALARAFLRDAPILVLDEPTSNLDPEEAGLLDSVIRRLCSGRTVLAIAHRLETVMFADQIAVLSAGKVAESGTHAQLQALGARYARFLMAYRGKE